MKKLLPFLIAFLLIFYVLPLIIKTSVILLTAFPILILIVSLIYGAFYGFNIILSIICAVLFVPAVLLTYGFLGFVYVAVFFVVSLVGNLLGLIFKKKM